MFRKDRTDSSGGGVCAIVKNSLNVKGVNVEGLDSRVELLGLDVICSAVHHRLFVVYRPPDSSRVYEHISSHDYMSDMMACIERNISTKGPTIVVGDLNCPDLTWDNCSIPTEGTSLQLHRFATVNGFTQAVNEPTRGNNLIDLVFTNQPFLMPSLNVTAPFSSSDHNSINFTIAVDGHNPTQLESPKRKYLWKQGDYVAMAQYLKNYDWLRIVSIYLTPDDLWRAFCDVMHEAVDMFVPSVETKNRNASRRVKKYPSKIRALCTRKRCVWKEMKRNPSSDNLRTKYKQLVCEYRSAVYDFECKRESELIDSSDVSSFYKYVNSRLHNSNASPVLTDLTGSFVFNCEIRNRATFHFPHPLSTIHFPHPLSTATFHPLSTSTQSNPSIHFPSNQFYHTHIIHTSIIFLKIVLILLFPIILFH